WISTDFFFGRRDWLASHDCQTCPVTALAEEDVRWAKAIGRLTPKVVFYDAILKRMEADNRKPPSRLQKLNSLRQRFLQSTQFIIDGNPEGLERTSRGVDSLPASPRDRPRDQLSQFTRRVNRSVCNDGASNP